MHVPDFVFHCADVIVVQCLNEVQNPIVEVVDFNFQVTPALLRLPVPESAPFVSVLLVSAGLRVLSPPGPLESSADYRFYLPAPPVPPTPLKNLQSFGKVTFLATRASKVFLQEVGSRCLLTVQRPARYCMISRMRRIQSLPVEALAGKQVLPLSQICLWGSTDSLSSLMWAQNLLEARWLKILLEFQVLADLSAYSRMIIMVMSLLWGELSEEVTFSWSLMRNRPMASFSLFLSWAAALVMMQLTTSMVLRTSSSLVTPLASNAFSYSIYNVTSTI